ncbi:MAG TPA: hypothetical protein ENI15_08850 [Spirochaetes bacterium]|nr:hypothetical protein [Spirochaetota bacterium]
MRNLKIGAKLVLGFLSVVVIFGGIAIYQITTLGRLAALQDEGAQRAKDAIALNDVKINLASVYPVIADAIINRDLEATVKDFESIKEVAEQDIAAVKELADTDEERRQADVVKKEYNSYLDTFESRMLPILEEIGDASQRAVDALAIKEVEIRAGDVYTLMADAVINRNITQTREDFARLKNEVKKDIAKVHELADTDEERVLAETFEEQYNKYLDVFEDRMLPVLAQGQSADMKKIRALDEEIDSLRESTLGPLYKISESLEQEGIEAAAGEREIVELDGELDNLREAALAPLTIIEESLEAENAEADEQFDAIGAQTTLLAIIVSIIAVVIAIAVAFMITRGITAALRQVADMGAEVASGGEEISATTQQISSGAQNQASTLEETSAAIEELSASVEQVSGHAQSQTAAVEQSSASMDKVSETMKEVEVSITSISESSSQIAGIINVISDIADQHSFFIGVYQVMDLCYIFFDFVL